ncbi:ATP-binding protein [Pseudonocardia phyllosphaerae]|uniref:ATP-binding protein n=1 Tax=Pseudonocardia phyllosphaerae TaxID=3390502 RepID=UPI00397DF09D
MIERRIEHGHHPSWLVRLPPEPESCRTARQGLARFLRPLLPEPVVEDAVLVLHELVANGVDHAGTPMIVTARVRGDAVRLAVHDGSTVPGETRPHDPRAHRGRGLQLVGTISRRWGIYRHRTGKTTWAELGPDPDTPAQPAPAVPAQRTAHRFGARRADQENRNTSLPTGSRS